MKKFTETKYYKDWYAKIEKQFLSSVKIDKITNEWEKLKKDYSEEEMTYENQAILFAQCVHRPGLKSPSQAVYPKFSEFDVTKKDSGLVNVSGYCDAPNSYGALTRGTFEVSLRYADGKWEYVVSKEKVHNAMLVYAAILGVIVLIFLPLILL